MLKHTCVPRPSATYIGFVPLGAGRPEANEGNEILDVSHDADGDVLFFTRLIYWLTLE